MDGGIYNNRYDAMVSHKDCYFYYNDREFMTVDWKSAPHETLDGLYRQRAQSIRDENEYVILAYSGGIDSTAVLEAFYYNNIHVDEILMVGAFAQDKVHGDDANHNADLYLNAFPTLRKLDLVHSKITISDYSLMFDDPEVFPIIRNWGTEWYKRIGYYLSVHNLFWHHLPTFLPTGKQTAVVFGNEKMPRVFFDFETKKYCLDFFDPSFTDYGNLPYDGDYKRVNFYSTPDIIRKQAHLLLQYRYAKAPLEERHIMNLLHPQIRNPLVHKSKKSVTNVLSVRDMFMTDKKGTEMYDVYATGIRRYHSEFKTNDALIAQRACYSRKYFLE